MADPQVLLERQGAHHGGLAILLRNSSIECVAIPGSQSFRYLTDPDVAERQPLA